MTDSFATHRRFLVLPIDMTLALLAFYGAGALRFDSLSPADWETFPGWISFLKLSAILVGAKALVFIGMGIYRNLWAYASLHDLYQILKSCVLGSVAAFIVLFLYNRLDGVSRSVLILDGLLLFLLLSFRSFSWRIVRDIILFRTFRTGKRTLLIGAGLAAGRLVREIRMSADYQMNPIGYLDSDPAKMGATLEGLPVIGKIADLESRIEELNIEEVIVTEKLSGSTVRLIYRNCETRGISCKTLPPLRELLTRPRIGNSLRDISLEDLLGRDVVNLETEGIRSTLVGKTILVTGAGGSIGSEVCRQLIQYQPAAMVLMELAETPLYEIDYELRNAQTDGKSTRIVSVIGDIRDETTLKQLFQSYDIQVVFHCAAYKHVPMMELNAGEAVLNNVLGTVRVANASRDAGVERFVMISTDKAVNPVNIMGATKRVAELYIQNLARTTDTKYITVRFGNVLGSNGSVIPLFQKQIAEGGPVTVTHPEIIRYFMTIPEAAGLVVQAGVMGMEGEIFILDMGEPVKIKDLAEDVIRFAGLVPHKDIEIRYIGLRPGEKLFEELLLDGEGIQPTRHKKIHIATSRNINLTTLLGQMNRLGQAARQNDRQSIDSIMAEILPEYRPVYTLGAPPAVISEKIEDLENTASEFEDRKQASRDFAFEDREDQGPRYQDTNP